MDDYSVRMANLLVGNNQSEAVIEWTLIGDTIRFHGDHIIALTGASFSATINGEVIHPWCSYFVKDGDVLKGGAVISGCRAYLAIAGGFDLPLVLNSYSTYIKAGIGGLKGRAFRKGDFIPSRRTNVKEGKKKTLSPELIPQYEDHLVARVLLGPNEDAFTVEGLHTFFQSTYNVTTQSDRMGYRLEGDSVAHKGKADIISNAVPMGSVQVPNDGQPIILMADCQPTGGYTSIALVASVDLPKVAQLRPGQMIQFVAISHAEAQDAYVKREKLFSKLQKLWR